MSQLKFNFLEVLVETSTHCEVERKIIELGHSSQGDTHAF